jgi:hypothetical protein
MTSNLRQSHSTTRQTPDLMLVMDTMRKFKSSQMKPSEIAEFSGLSRERTDAALRDAEDRGPDPFGLLASECEGEAVVNFAGFLLRIIVGTALAAASIVFVWYPHDQFLSGLYGMALGVVVLIWAMVGSAE